MPTNDLIKRFTSHSVDRGGLLTMEAVREKALDLAQTIDLTVHDSREKSLALTHLEEAVFWANAGISRPPKLDA